MRKLPNQMLGNQCNKYLTGRIYKQMYLSVLERQCFEGYACTHKRKDIKH